MSFYKPNGGEIATNLIDEIDKIRASQYKIGSVASEYIRDNDFVRDIEDNYDYVLKCVAQYETTKDIILIPND